MPLLDSNGVVGNVRVKVMATDCLDSNHSMHKSTRRAERGNMLILITAFTVICLALLFFALGFVRLVGSSSEQKTAIEAAAIAAARDISAIVIDTPDFGYIGLSDSAPTGSFTAAGDDYYLPVHSINTLIGTARLDYLIASQPGLDIPAWRELAATDLARARAASQDLIDTISNAINPGGTATNKNGQTIKPYQSAEDAYKQNLIRMTGGSSYVEGSMNLSLGAVEGSTCVPVPKPITADPSLDSTNTSSGCYKSYVNVPLGNEDFVFAGIGSSIKLVDLKRWVPSIEGLPYQFPTIVRAEAQQLVNNATGPDQILKSVACAQPASVFDPRPYPGALTISFPDGMPDGQEPITKPLDLYGPLLSQDSDESDYFDATPGDYPTSAGSQITPSTSWPIASDPKVLASSACKLAVYDWLRRAGTRADVDSVVGMHHTPFLPQGPDVPWPPDHPVGNIPRGIAHIYKFDTDGVIDYEGVEQKPFPYWVVSDRQNLVECFDVLTKGAEKFTVQPVPLAFTPLLQVPLGQVEFTGRYDLFVRIYSRKYGDPGGKHEGEPMDNNLVSHCKLKIHGEENRGFSSVYREFNGKGALRQGGLNLGIGAIPVLTPQDDFAYTWAGVLPVSLTPSVDNDPALYEKYDGSGPGVRPTYSQNGSVADIRFRRVVIGKDPTSTLLGVVGQVLVPIEKQQGYVGQK